MIILASEFTKIPVKIPGMELGGNAMRILTTLILPTAQDIV